MAYQKNKHDIGIVDVGSAGAGTTVIGMMLATQQDGSKAYREYDGKYLADQFFTGTPSQAYMNPEEELILAQTDWRKGFGEEYYDDPKRYYSSIGMDLRHKGMAIAGWTPTTVTKPGTIASAATLVNKDFELAANWTNGARSNEQAHDGTFSWKLSGAATTAYQDAATFGATWQSKVFSFSCWIYSAFANKGRIGITDGTDTTWGSYQSTATTWQLFTVTHTANAGAVRVRCQLDTIDGNGVYFDDCEIGSPVAGKTVAFANFNDELYMASGSTLSKLNAGGTAYDAVHGLPATITDIEAFTDDQLYIAMGTSQRYYEMTTAEVLQANGLANNTMQFIKTVHGASPTMYANDAGNKLRSNTDPSHAGANAWSGQTTVGSSYYDITDLIAWRGLLYIMKEDKPYYLDSTPAIQDDLARELETEYATTSGKNAFVWKNKLYIPCGDQALLETDGTTNTFRNPANYCTNLTDFVGRISAIAGDGFYLYITVNNGNDSEILAGRLETIDDTTSWVWHPIAEVSISSVHRTSDTTNTIAAADATNQATIDTLLNEIKADYNLHIASTTYHLGAGTNTVTAANSSDEATAVALANEIKGAYTLHVRSSVHLGEDTDNKVSSAYATDLATAITLANEEKVDYNAHILLSNGAETMFLSNVYQKRLWIAPTNSAEDLYYLPSPQGYGDAENDANRLFKTGTYFETPWLHGGFRSEDKAWIKLTLTMGHAYNVNDYFTVHYKVLGGSYVSIGNFTGISATNMIQSRFIDTTNKPFSPMIRLKFTAVTGAVSRTPILLNYDVRAIMYPTIKKVIHCVVRCAEEMIGRQGIRRSEYNAVKDTLDNARNNAVWPVSIRDINGDTLNVKFLPVSQETTRMLPIKIEKGREMERLYHLLMLEVPLS